MTNETRHHPLGRTWKPANRVLYRFMAAYLLLYSAVAISFPFAFLHAAVTRHFVFYDEVAFRSVVPWIAAHVLRLHEPLSSSLAGDASFQWVEHFTLLLMAVIAAVVWSAGDRKRGEYHVLDLWLRLFARLSLAVVLFAYGFDKVFPIQFHSISRYDLVQQFGDLSHFDLMWKFMAASKGYTILSGVLEVLAGVLLLIPELASLGALLAAVVMANVVALNFAYNIPVKLFSTNLLMMAVYLSAPELPRLFNLLVRNRTVLPRPLIVLSPNRAIARGAWIAQRVFGGAFFLIFCCMEALHYRSIRRDASVVVPLQGIWLVDDLNVAGGTPKSLFTPKLLRGMSVPPGEERWAKLVFDRPGDLMIQLVNGELDYVSLAWKGNHEDAVITDSSDTMWTATLNFQQTLPNTLAVRGVVNGVDVAARLHRMDETRFRVRDEGLHLVQPGE